MKINSTYTYLLFLFGILLTFSTESMAQKKLKNPQNYGGKKEYKRFFEQELNYPQSSIDKDIGGRVLLEVEVDSMGKVLSTRVKESVGRDVDSEALRIAALLLWEPASLKGHKLAGTSQLKFKFNPYAYEGIIMERGFRVADYPKNSPTIVWEEKELETLPEIQSRFGSFKEYVNEKLIFPEEAKAKQVDGYVEVFFVIEPNGRVSNVKLIKSLEGNCDVVALDLIHRSRWTPGNQAGIPIRSIRREKLGFYSFNPNKALFHSGEQTPNR